MGIAGIIATIILTAWLAISVALAWRLDAWRASVDAMHLRWERQQRQAALGAVPLAQRQKEQAAFEQRVAERPLTMIAIQIAFTVIIGAIVIGISWRLDELDWILRWLVAPLLGTSVLATLLAWLAVRGSTAKLANISSSLYGPAPPRVKVKTIQTQDVTLDSL